MISQAKCTDKTRTLPTRTCAFCLFVLVFTLGACSTTPEKKTAAQDEGYVIQAVQYMNAGRLDAALASVKKALEFNPKSPDAYTVAGLIYSKNNQIEQAERYFKRALSFDPNHSAAQTNYASFLCKHDKPLAAEKIFLDAAKNKNNPQRDVAYTNAGLCVLGIPDKARAMGYFSQALKINPKSPVPWYQLAKIQYGNYSYENAYKLLQEYEKVATPTPKTLLLGAQINDAKGDPQLADKYKLLLVQRFPNSKEAKSVNPPKLRQQPAAYDVRNLNVNEQAY